MPAASGQGGKEGEQWVRVIDGALQEWEAKSVVQGRHVSDTDMSVHGTRECAVGIRRRIQKRAIAGDDQAQAIVAGCTRR